MYIRIIYMVGMYRENWERVNAKRKNKCVCVSVLYYKWIVWAMCYLKCVYEVARATKTTFVFSNILMRRHSEIARDRARESERDGVVGDNLSISSADIEFTGSVSVQLTILISLIVIILRTNRLILTMAGPSGIKFGLNVSFRRKCESVNLLSWSN